MSFLLIPVSSPLDERALAIQALRAGSINMTTAVRGSSGISNCALGGDIGVRQNEEFPAGTDDMVDRLSVLARGGRAVLCITAKWDPLRSEMGHSR